MNYFIIAVFCVLPFLVEAQPGQGLIAYYSFDDCTPADNGGISGAAAFIGTPDCVCGVSGNAIELNGFDEEILLLNAVNNTFETNDFTVSLYIKSTSAAGTQSVFNKRESCGGDNAFGIRINPPANSVSVELSQEQGIAANVSGSLDFSSCWQHLVVVRSGATTALYVNAQLIEENVNPTGTRVDLRNNNAISIGGGACVSGAVDNRFSGIIDEVRVYERAFTQRQVENLYLAPDRISTNDTTIFLGNSVNIRTSASCADDFDWMPSASLSDASIANPVATPTETTTYSVFFNDGICAAEDSLTIRVINPDDLPCDDIYMAKAFTPNGDNLNDEYGISNPYAIESLVSFEIFDRWGAKLFSTDNPFEKWDGSVRGQALNPGVLIYKVRFTCNGEEDTRIGSFSIIR